ncbi:hypothetical protein J27TS7_45920 [Paenibacillus dendritiformis]|nr:hypothetical protein J27TS7_45920 [Paenibacillus dendritiformis]
MGRLIALGLLAIKKPETFTFTGILDEPSDNELLIIQFRGVVGLIAGIVTIVLSIQFFLV